MISLLCPMAVAPTVTISSSRNRKSTWHTRLIENRGIRGRRPVLERACAARRKNAGVSAFWLKAFADGMAVLVFRAERRDNTSSRACLYEPDGV